jgi:hypothetical protein
LCHGAAGSLRLWISMNKISNYIAYTIQLFADKSVCGFEPNRVVRRNRQRWHSYLNKFSQNKSAESTVGIHDSQAFTCIDDWANTMSRPARKYENLFSEL